MNQRRWAMLLSAVAFSAAALPVIAGDQDSSVAQSEHPVADSVLSGEQFREVDRAANRALAWLATTQQDDGSFRTYDTGQPAVTALTTLAFMSYGHLPGQGQYGATIERAIGYVVDGQFPDGLLARAYPSMYIDNINPAHTAAYNHAIAGLCLSESYGLTAGKNNDRIRSAIQLAVAYTHKRLPSPKRADGDEGGWRYAVYKMEPSDSDLSITSWQLMFLRSCKNAGFEVPQETIEQALAYVRRTYEPRMGVFLYGIYGSERNTTRAITAAGILSLSLGGQHQSEQAKRAGLWLLHQRFDEFNSAESFRDRYFYSLFYSSQAMFQLGGRYWAGYYPNMLHTLLANQRPDGSWPPESHNPDNAFGSVYSTAMALLAISPPYQVLPIFQR